MTMLSHATFSLFTFFCFMLVTNAQNDDEMTNYSAARGEMALDDILKSAKYDKSVRPRGENGYAEVRVNLFVRSIDKIDDINKEFGCQIILRQQWNDKRLVFDDEGGKIEYISITDQKKIWLPDLFFGHSKEGHIHNIVAPNILVKIYPNGDILYSARISLLLNNPMNLKDYPFDTQLLRVTIASYGSNKQDVVLKWRDDTPVQIAKDIDLPTFTLSHFFADYCDSMSATGGYSCLKFELKFVREIHYHLLQWYIPFFMLTVLSWVSFWLDPKALTARVTLVVATLLTMTVLAFWINTSVPPASYTKAIDVWTGVCLTFVFCALLVLATVNYCSRKKDEDELNDDIENTTHCESDKIDGVQDHLKSNPNSEAVGSNTKKTIQESKMKVREMCKKCKGLFRRCMWCTQPHPLISGWLDAISKILFPVAFFIFNICYWTTYLPRE